jgi:hypothetical protein
MNPNTLRFMFGMVTGVGLFATIIGDWRSAISAALAFIGLRLLTQGDEP